MKLHDQFIETWMPRTLALLRWVVGFLYLQHGTAKLLHMPHVSAYDLVAPWSLGWVAGIMETVGAPLLILGLCTRPVTFLLSGQMAIAYFLVHAPMGHALSPMQNQGEPAVLYCFMFLHFAVAGGGAWSLDGIIARHRQRLAR